MEKLQKCLERLDAKTKAMTEFLRGPAQSKEAAVVLQQMEIRRAFGDMSPADRRKLLFDAVEGKADPHASVCSARHRSSATCLDLSKKKSDPVGRRSFIRK